MNRPNLYFRSVADLDSPASRRPSCSSSYYEAASAGGLYSFSGGLNTLSQINVSACDENVSGKTWQLNSARNDKRPQRWGYMR
jgi:hypothetical protein